MPKVLVISNNVFSYTSSVGKTLASFFEWLPKNNIAQLYFKNEIPEHHITSNYYRITDSDVINTLIKTKDVCGNHITTINCEDNLSLIRAKKGMRVKRKTNFKRILREIFWSFKKWQSSNFIDWLDDFKPDVIFLYAGDTGFAYNILEFVKTKYNCKSVVYIADDYILPRRSINIFWWLRRNYIIRKMQNAISDSDLFITISEEMRLIYKDIFDRDSFIAMNMTGNMKNDTLISNHKNGLINLIYAGGFHFNRYKTLNLLALSINKFNTLNTKVKLFLNIYSNSKPEEKILKKINVDGASKYRGSLDSLQLKKELNNSDILVHVESFDLKSIYSTRLSISTKISEYLSLSKPILAIGSDKVSSIKYLEECAFCITSKTSFYQRFSSFILNEQFQKEISKKAIEKYLNNHSPLKVKKEFEEAIMMIYNKN